MPSNKPTNLGSPWNFSQLWNKALQSFPERPLVPRSHMWASELGQSYINRYLKMNAVPMTNPPNDRSRRKFVAGHCWEWIVKMVLTSCGILKAEQLRCEYQIKGMIKTTGRLDFVAGGEVDWEKAKEKVKGMQQLFDIAVGDMPPFILHAIDYIIADLEKVFAKNPLKKVIFECKSVSSFMFEKVLKIGAMPHHVLTQGHYILGNEEGLDEAYILYISKDDVLTEQFSVVNTPELLKAYKADVKQMTEYYNAGFDPKNPLKFAPPKDPEVLFTEGAWRFEKNFNVEYSSYLTMLYGYAQPKDYSNKWGRIITSWNRVFKRYVKEENITPKNKLVRDDAVAHGFEWDKYVKKAKAAGAFADATDDEEEAA